MTSAEVVLSAALGASALTGGASLGVVWFQEWRRGKAVSQDALHAAILELMSRSMALAMRARAMGEMMKIRSGLKEGLDVTLHHRKPVDALELHDWMAQDFVPLNAALSEIWTRWDQEGIRLANDLAGKCADLLGAATVTTPARSAWERMRIWAAGERWTPEMITASDQAVNDLALARKRLADYARGQLGRASVNLFTQADGAPAGEIGPPEPVPDSAKPSERGA